MSEPMNHETANGLLPWYANGTLADDERQHVDDHVHACLTCHLEFKKEHELNELVRASPTVNLAPEEGFDRLSRRLDDDARGGRSAVEQLAGAVERLWAPLSTLSSATRFSMAALVLLAVAGVLSWRTIPPPVVQGDPVYFTLSSESESAGSELDIVFAADISGSELRALVTEIDGFIISGPTALGRYRIRLTDDAVDEAHLSDLIRTLSHDERVRFAGPSFAGEETAE